MNDEELFHRALEKPTLAEQLAVLAQLCSEQPEQRQRVEGLLRANHDRDSFLQLPDTIAHTSAEHVGAMIGPYKLLERIGEGGMGVVWMAQQTEPVKRLVALKVIKPGMATEQFVARFEAERQALALMDHPNIARVLDAGTVAADRPYFVMELVKGVPLTTYCDQHRLTPRQRLELFIPVCEAVQHAHQKGIIHRDLKPTNVLVALYDGKPVPKVIDFGIAKAAGAALTDKTLVTGFGAIVGTLEYMSPEQAQLNQIDVDTRSDIYTLGVLLYELLTGSPPFSMKQLAQAGMLEMLRLVREQEPTRPSTKLSTVDSLPTLAATRGTTPDKLAGLVRGELDWIVMKCLEKDRNRRYDSARDLALDLQRHLADEPVQACPPSVSYLLRKQIRRHKRTVLAATLVVLALAGGIIGTTLGMVRAQKAQHAEAERAEGEHNAKEVAEKRLAQFEKGLDVFGSLFENLDPFAEEKNGRPLRSLLGEQLDQVAAELDGDTIGDPLVVARLQDRLGRTYLALGHAVKAEALFRKAHTTRRTLLGADDPLTLASASLVARATFEMGKRPEALTLFEQVRDQQMQTLGDQHPDTLATMQSLALCYRFTGRTREAVPLLEHVRTVREKLLGREHPQTLATLQKLASVYLAAEQRSDAVKLCKQVLDIHTKKHGPDHPHTIAAMNDLAYAYQFAYRMNDAHHLLEQARVLSEARLGPNYPLTLTILHNLGRLYRAFGGPTKAITLLDEVRQRRVLALGGHHPATLATLHELALSHEVAGDMRKARPLFEQAALGIEQLQFAHGDAEAILEHLCHGLEHDQHWAEAERWWRKWLAAVEKNQGRQTTVYRSALLALGTNLVHQKKFVQAEPLLTTAFTALQTDRPTAWGTYHAQSLLGAALLGQQKYEAAEPLLVEGYRGMKKTMPKPGKKRVQNPNDAILHEAGERVVQLYEAWNMKEKADEWRQELNHVP